MAGSPNILCIIGATASGKSALAEMIADRTGAELVSVDSMQVYRGMDIGTAKPSPSARARIPHHLIDLADPTEDFSVARFVELADQAIKESLERERPIILCGGTPLYFKALFEGIFAGPSADPELRQELSTFASETLHARLRAVDPLSASRIHVNDRRRLIRALEVFETTGSPIASLQTEWSQGSARHDATWFGIGWNKEELNRRINQRVREMLSAGWVEEVRVLLDKYGSLSKSASQAAGYAQIIRHLKGELSLEDTAEEIKIATRQLARRQMKWFRRFPGVTWLEGEQGLQTHAARVLEVWHQRGTHL